MLLCRRTASSRYTTTRDSLVFADVVVADMAVDVVMVSGDADAASSVATVVVGAVVVGAVAEPTPMAMALPVPLLLETSKPVQLGTGSIRRLACGLCSSVRSTSQCRRGPDAGSLPSEWHWALSMLHLYIFPAFIIAAVGALCFPLSILSHTNKLMGNGGVMVDESNDS